MTSPNGQVKVKSRKSFDAINIYVPSLKQAITFTGRQRKMRRMSVVARLARKVFVGDLNELFLITVRMMRRLPDTPKQKMKLQ